MSEQAMQAHTISPHTLSVLGAQQAVFPALKLIRLLVNLHSILGFGNTYSIFSIRPTVKKCKFVTVF